MPRKAGFALCRAAVPEGASLETRRDQRWVQAGAGCPPKTLHLELDVLPNPVPRWFLHVVPQQWPLGCCVSEGCALLRAPTRIFLPPLAAALPCRVRLQVMWQSKKRQFSTFWFPPLPSCVIPTAMPIPHLCSEVLKSGIKPRSFHTVSLWACRDLTRVSSGL